MWDTSTIRTKNSPKTYIPNYNLSHKYHTCFYDVTKYKIGSFVIA